MAADRSQSAIAIAIAVALVGCADEPKLALGAQCDLSSECEAPLACRLERCRVECATVRDCDIGAACLLDDQGLGACQLPDERDCTADSDCAGALVCRFRQCINECRIDRDCPPGSTCETDRAGQRGCVDAAERGCSSRADCPSPLICANDGVCRDECANDRDCRGGTVCEDGVCRRPTVELDGGSDAGPDLDAGPMDAGADAGTDAGTDAGPPGDAGAADAGGPPLLESAVDVAAARSGTSCAVMDSGALWCWGNATFLGAPSTTPTDVGGLSDALQVSLGDAFGCVLHGGTVSCWGDNYASQLGDGTTTSSATPVDVVGLPSDIAQVAVGFYYACARTTSGQVWCWGLNDSLQCGSGGYTQPTPTRIGTFDDAEQVAAGYDHNCVLHTGGTVSCWGGNYWDQLADDTVSESATPLAIAGIDDALAVGAGHSSSCALRSTGEVWCWGARTSGELGDGTTSGRKLTPGPVTGLSDATALAMGAFHSCAGRASGEAVCWGDNGSGQLGTGLTVSSATTPVRVLGLTDIVALDTGQDHTCALRTGGLVSCWGRNADGELGNETPGTWSTRPIPVLAP